MEKYARCPAIIAIIIYENVDFVHLQFFVRFMTKSYDIHFHEKRSSIHFKHHIRRSFAQDDFEKMITGNKCDQSSGCAVWNILWIVKSIKMFTAV